MVMRFIFRQSPHLSARFETQNGLPNNRDMIMEGKKWNVHGPFQSGDLRTATTTEKTISTQPFLTFFLSPTPCSSALALTLISATEQRGETSANRLFGSDRQDITKTACLQRGFSVDV